MKNIKCQRPGCFGVIVDGVCDDCGKPPIGQSLLADIAPAAANNSTNGVSSLTGTRGSRVSSRRSNRSTRISSNRRQALGGGLVSLPAQPSQDPLKMVMPKPEVPAGKRRCPGCDVNVNRLQGFCPQCGQAYNFEPSLKAGDIVHGKFEIKGPIAFGGQGWIYLAWDQMLSRWVVLKGLLNRKDESSVNAALVERQFLAAVKHPKIVGIYDFVQRPAEQGEDGYIVMEYVGGRTLGNLRKAHGVLPVEEAIAYILGILPAFAYLHGNGYVYCDFKPENFMLEDDDVKLIDMGGVRRIGDPSGDIYGTKGYMAPEANNDPFEVSDLYTIGRTLAVLIMDFKYQSIYEQTLPSPQEQPVLADNESLYRFLLRATQLDPDQRFQSADEMSDQLYGVLREIVALKTDPKPAESQLFTTDNLLDADDQAGSQSALLRLLPALKMDMKDLAANDLLRVIAMPDPLKRANIIELIVTKFGDQSAEARLRAADALIDSENFMLAAKHIETVKRTDMFDWRVHWYYGKYYLAQGNADAARNSFRKVYFELPGELAPKLALAFAAENSKNTQDIDDAVRFYRRVAKVDPNYTSACFGLARCLLANPNPAAVAQATQAVGMVPVNHSLYTQARITQASILMHDEASMNEGMLNQAAQVLGAISAQGGVLHQLSGRLLALALAMIKKGSLLQDKTNLLLGHPVEQSTLQQAAEAEYRQAARFAANANEKTQWVNLANKVRPRTWI